MDHWWKTGVGAAGIGMLALTGCVGMTEEQPVPTPDEIAERAEEPSPDVTESPAESEGPDATESPDDGEPDEEVDEPEQGELNSRGNLPMPDSSPQEFIDTATGDQIAVLDASDVHTDFTCNRVSAIEPDGTFFAIDFEVSVPEEASPHLPDGFLLNTPHFEIIDSDGSIVGDRPTTHAANNCLDDSSKYPRGSVRPGSTASGPIVFETPVESGYLVYREMYTGSYYEWEFNLE
ncbi:DUF4352 domain-containing protein [Nesterenkonia suensis]